jgi:YebC/PmpR family DNA-binding regulatory protein
MSGHSKWATIKRKKGAADAKRGQQFTKLGNAIAIAAREGADPETNFKLRLAVDKAKAANMPVANIEKSIARGSGKDKDSASIEEIVYEGYGPAGVAVIVECATDNRNRASADVRTVFSKHGGNLAESGSVAYQFSQKGVITIKTNDVDTTTLNAIDAGALDIESSEDVVEVYTAAKDLNKVRLELVEKGEVIESAELAYLPNQEVPISDSETGRKVSNLLEALEELDDVSNVSSNADFAQELIETLAQ